MSAEFLVTTEWLDSHLTDADIRIFDCAIFLRPCDPAVAPYRPEPLVADFKAGHIPGAGFIDIHETLSDKESKYLFMDPPHQQFADVVGAAGVGPESQVVLYSSEHPKWATRLWWMFKAHGFDRVAVLDGGFQKWKAEARPISQTPCAYLPETFTATPPQTPLFVDATVIKTQCLSGPKDILVNSLAPGIFSGEWTRYGRLGRIPGAISIPADSLIASDGTFIPLPDLKKTFEDHRLLDASRVFTHCGGGVSATIVNFMLLRLGNQNVQTYDASLGQWAWDPDCSDWPLVVDKVPVAP